MSRFKLTLLLFVSIFAVLPLFAADDDATKSLDVTKKVADEVKENKLSITANNDLFTDPAEGIGKRLRIEYTLGTEAKKALFNENDAVEIVAPAGQKLEIKKAVYGVLGDPEAAPAAAAAAADGKPADVAKILTDAVKDGKLSVAISNESMGGDPVPGTVKQVVVEYTVAGKDHKATANEGDTLELPVAADGAGALVIKKATYGAPN